MCTYSSIQVWHSQKDCNFLFYPILITTIFECIPEICWGWLTFSCFFSVLLTSPQEQKPVQLSVWRSSSPPSWKWYYCHHWIIVLSTQSFGKPPKMKISQPQQTPRFRGALVFQGKCFFLMSTLKLASHSLIIAPYYTAWCYLAPLGSIVPVITLQTVTDFKQIPLSLPFARQIKPSTTSLSL